MFYMFASPIYWCVIRYSDMLLTPIHQDMKPSNGNSGNENMFLSRSKRKHDHGPKPIPNIYHLFDSPTLSLVLPLKER